MTELKVVFESDLSREDLHYWRIYVNEQKLRSFFVYYPLSKKLFFGKDVSPPGTPENVGAVTWTELQ